MKERIEALEKADVLSVYRNTPADRDWAIRQMAIDLDRIGPVWLRERLGQLDAARLTMLANGVRELGLGDVDQSVAYEIIVTALSAPASLR